MEIRKNVTPMFLWKSAAPGLRLERTKTRQNIEILPFIFEPYYNALHIKDEYPYSVVIDQIDLCVLSIRE
jgi:hypothetical protein